jgi:multiple sugar transport system substrate-binding protein
MVFLQQAGGKIIAKMGCQPSTTRPARRFADHDHPMPYTDPGAISYVGINDATNVFTSGNASMMMNWPFMWVPANDPASSKIVGQVATDILPAGPVTSASIDGTDAYTIATLSPNPELSRQLVEFYLDNEVQKRQVLDTGWLPIRLSVLGDPEVQAAAPNAASVLEQAKFPYDSFVTPDYNAVTTAIGVGDPGSPGQGQPLEALQDASDQVTEIVKHEVNFLFGDSSMATSPFEG